MTNTNKLLADFNRYFTSGNDVDVPERVPVPRDEWRELHAALAQSGRVVGTVTGYQSANGLQQWQFNPSNVAGLENQRFDVALSTSTAAPTICGMPVVIDESMPADQFKFVQPAPTPSQAAVTELVDSLSNVEKEYELLAAMRNIELRRPRRSFGIRVMSDELAVEWQVLDKRLDGLIDARRRTLSAHAKKEGRE